MAQALGPGRQKSRPGPVGADGRMAAHPQGLSQEH